MNENANNFLSSFGFILAFLVLVFLLDTFAGENILFWFLLLVFLSMAIVNSEKISSLINSITGG